MVAAKAVIDHSLQAWDTIAVEEVLAHLGATIETLNALIRKTPSPLPAADNLTEVRLAIEHEQAEAACLRVAWMAETGNDPHDIEASLRHNHPQSAAEEQDLLDLVRKQLEWERAYDEAMRTGT